MPSIISKIAGTVGSFLGGPSVGAFFSNFGLSFFDPVSFLVNIALKVAVNALTKRPRRDFGPISQFFSEGAAQRTQLIQQAITNDRIVYGQVLLSGPLAFAESHDNKTKLTLAVVVADHQIAGYGETFFDDEHVPFSSPVASGKYLGLAEQTLHLGTDDQVADSALVAISGANWSNQHRGRGRAYPRLKLTFDRDKFSGGIPTPKWIINGKLVWDPRTTGVTITSSAASGTQVTITTPAAHGLAVNDRAFIRDHITAAPGIEGQYAVLAVADTTHFTIRLGFDTSGDEIPLTTPGAGGTVTQCLFEDNPALNLTDYLLDKRLGEGADLDEIDITAVIAAAHDCDEWVATETSVTFTVNAGTDEITLSSAAAAMRTGDTLTLTTTGTLPAGSAVGTAYYWIRNTSSSTVGKIATTFANANDGAAIDLTTAGSGAHTLRRAACAAFTVNDLGRDELAQESTSPVFIGLGNKVEVLTTGTLPAGLAVSTTYYHIPLTQTLFKLATSRRDALDGAAIDVTTAGTGTHTIIRAAEPRYTCNGMLDTGDNPHENIEKMRSAMAGVVVPIGGKFTMYAGVSTASTETLVDADLRAAIQVIPQRAKKQRFNTAAGLYVNPMKNWEPDELPPVTAQTYRDEDNGETITNQFSLEMTTSNSMGQRLMNIELGHNRNMVTVLFPCNLGALRFQPWDVFTYTNTRFGWVAQEFRILGWTLNMGDARTSPGIDITARIETAAMWAWAQATSEFSSPPASINALQRSDSINAPTGLVVTSGTAVLGLAGDGTIISRAKLAYTEPVDGFLRGYEAAWKKTADGNWESATFDAPQAEYFIGPLVDGAAYDFAVRAINTKGVRSDTNNDPATWANLVTGHTVGGKSVLPSDVASLIVQQNGELVTFKWPAISDLDRDGYELRYMATPFAWASAILISEETKGTLVTNRAVPPGAWVIGIKAIDTSGNYSANAVTASVTISNDNDIVASRIEHPRWTGTLTGFIRHDVSGTLIPDSNTLAKDMTDAQLWDQMVYDPVATPTYEAKEIDLGFDADGVRVFAEMKAVIGPGESGVADPTLEIDYRDEGDSYDGFEAWPTAAAADFRRLKARAKITTATGVAALKEFKPIADVAERTEKGTATIAIGGTTITFAQRFHSTPNIQVTVDGVSALFPVKENVTGLGFDVTVYNSSGIDVGGTVDWQAIGA